MTNLLARKALADFTCLGAECEDTCCQSWNMQVDDAALARMKQTAPELLDSVTGPEDGRVMKRDQATDFCVRFEGGLCGIQKRYGSDLLSDACHFYPRITRRLGETITVTGALSCPEMARLALFSDTPFAPVAMSADRLPQTLTDYTPDGLTPEQALAIHESFLAYAASGTAPPETLAVRIHAACESLSRVPASRWPDAVPFYLEHAGTGLPAAEPKATDPVFLAQALCGLVSAAKKVRQPRLAQTIHEMQAALHVSIPFDTLAITPLPDAAHAIASLQARWQTEGKARFAPVLQRYLAAQLSQSLFPLAGFGDTLPERSAIIGIRFATVRLGLMSLPAGAGPSETVRVVQSLSRFLDHLAEPEFSLRIYRETGWMTLAGLRGLLEIA